MKISLLLVVIVLLSSLMFGCGSSGAQKAVSEQAITQKVKKSFPTHTIISTQKEDRNGNDVFTVETKDGQSRQSLVYSEKGALIEMTQSVQSAQLPVAITNSVVSHYPDGIIFAAYKISKGKTTSYHIGIKSGGKRVEMNLHANGTPIVRK